jgi:hypothetical protein
MPSLLARFKHAANAFLGRSIAPFDLSWTRGWEMRPLYDPGASIEAFGDRFALYASVSHPPAVMTTMM